MININDNQKRKLLLEYFKDETYVNAIMQTLEPDQVNLWIEKNLSEILKEY